ncbi:MAG: cytochrome c-type biogenesis protein [Halioglobus sp.]
MKIIHVLLLTLALLPLAANAVIETYEFSSRDLEVRYQRLSAELRCPKCQNQNIADSNAPIAQDLRKLLHQQLEAGSGDAEIKEFMVSRYGEFVLYRPRFSAATASLWLAPVALLILALIVVVMSFRRRTQTPVGKQELSAEDAQRLNTILKDSEDGA